jgi:hypothetical protein
VEEEKQKPNIQEESIDFSRDLNENFDESFYKQAQKIKE